MDIKELNKTQLVLVTLLITFVVSIATGIVTVSLMQQAPKRIPQTINNVIQRTIEKVTTEPAVAPAPTTTTPSKTTTFGDGDVLVSIYSNDTATPASSTLAPSSLATTTPAATEPKPLGQGIIISDVGLILVDSSVLTDKDAYQVMLNKTYFDAIVIKKYNNGFSVLKISPKVKPEVKPAVSPSAQGASASSANIDKKQ